MAAARPSAFPTLRRALAWWLGTLAEMAASLTPDRRGGRLTATETGGILLIGRRDGPVILRLPPHLSAAEARAQAARLGHRLPPVDLRLPEAAVLRKRLSLPAAVEANLVEVIGLEIDRQTPFRRQDMVWGHRIAERRGSLLNVEIALVPRTAVADWHARLAGAGLTPGDLRLDDWPQPLAAAATAPRGPRVTQGLALAAALAGIAAVAVPAGLQRIEEDALETQLAAVQVQAGIADRLRGEWERQQGGGLETLRQGEAGALALLDGLARLLPDTVFLTELRLAEREATLAGYAPDAAELIALIERSGLLEGARFLAPVTSDPIRRRERFQIGATLKTGGTP